MLSSYFLSQIFASISLLILIISYQLESRKSIIACLGVSCTILAFHFQLLNQPTACALVSLSALRYFVSYFTTSKHMLMFFILLTILASFFTYYSPLTFIACSAAVAQSTAAFQSSQKSLRILMMFGTALWIIHNILVPSPVAVMSGFVVLSSNFIGFQRFCIKPAVQSG